VVAGASVHAEMSHRGDDSLHQAKLSGRGCAGIELSEPSESDAVGMGCSLFCGCASGHSIEAQGDGRLCIEGGKTSVWYFPDFHYYCIADGLTSIFTRHPGRIVTPLPKAIAQYTLFLFKRLRKNWGNSCLQEAVDMAVLCRIIYHVTGSLI
jgi:hypothetical protein